MKKLFWTGWGVGVAIAIVSFFRPMSFDSQITEANWLQITASNGGVRFVAVKGDSSASWTAATVIERDKNTWRAILNADMWGRIGRQTSPVDLLGTMVDTLRVDVPFLGLLLLIPAFSASRKAFRKWGAPPRLVWAELWTLTPDRRRFSVYVRRGFIAVSISLALGIAVLWAVCSIGLPRGWGYFGDKFAFGTRKAWLGFQIPLFQDGSFTLSESIDSVAAEQRDAIGSQKSFFSIELRPKRVAFHYYAAEPVYSKPIDRSEYRFGGIEYEQTIAAGPSIESPTLLPRNQGVVAFGEERTLSIPSWMLVGIFSAWPLLAFLRGPFRRARRRFANRCLHCGYNLTGLIEPRCPECGTKMDINVVTTSGTLQTPGSSAPLI